MVDIRIRYLETRRLADGSIAYYYCPPRKAQAAGIGLPEALGKDPVEAVRKAEEQNKRIDDWRAGKHEGVRTIEGTVGWLIDKFEKSTQYRKLAPATRDFYTGALKALRNHNPKGVMAIGDLPARRITPAFVDDLYLALQKLDADGNPTQLPWANAIMRSARRLFSLAVRWEIITTNPFAKMELTAAPARETVIPREHVDLFCVRASEMGRPSMALWARLSFELCQRAGDARTLPWSRYNGHEVQVKQSKGGSMVWAPLLPDLPELKAMLDAAAEDKKSTVIVVDETTGHPYTKFSLSKAFNPIRDAAGLPSSYQARDMRRAGLDETGDAGATDDELRSLSGHKSRNVVSVYVKPNRTKAANALAKRRQHRAKSSGQVS
jgi:hypothetical protein